MNVPLPGQQGSPTEFWLIVALIAAILLGVLLFFRRRGYL
jgi:LPXTG-motif cell wall-anchored protein